jgi:hypothetical protein
MEDSPPEKQISTPPASMENYVNVDSGDELPRTKKRILWTQEEDVRMVSLVQFHGVFSIDTYYNNFIKMLYT